MSDSGIVRGLSETDKPLCPNVTSPRSNKEHEIHVRTTDAFYDAAERDADDEFVNENTGKAYYAAAYDKISNKMNLYFARVHFYVGNKQKIVETYWFQCHICGLILPAYEKR
jgi:hypothetical protein